jgi:K(+)-stimulated pyrophosphate-energized sodium pump
VETTLTTILASEGGWQEFTLRNGEWLVLALSGLAALVALAVGWYLAVDVMKRDQGTPKMRQIAVAIQQGAWAYLRRQFLTIAVILVPVGAIVYFTSTEIVNEGTGAVAFTQAESGLWRTVAFLLGCIASGLTGYIGMTLATRGNVRTAAAARRGSMSKALNVAFRTGGVAGMFTVGLGLLGATAIIAIFQNSSSAMLVGFGFGGSLLALFLRVGGGIFTKAADVGADLVGKVEAGIPEDDPRNPATIADNVGDNVGDCAGMASDLFESYEVTLVAAIILGVAAFASVGMNPALGLVFPLAARAIGVIASIIGVFSVRATPADTSAMEPINRGFLSASIVTVLGTLALALAYIRNPAKGTTVEFAENPVGLSNIGWRVFGAVVIGLVLAQVLSRLTEYFTGTEHGPVKEIAQSAKTGPATVVLSGTSSGLESSVYAIICIAVALGSTIWMGGGNLMFSLYLVALCGMGMLATTGVIVSEDTFGPVSDNAAGIAEMAGELEGDTRKVLVSLDAVGNTTKAVTKGFAIGSAVIAAVALFSSYIETIAKELGIEKAIKAALGEGEVYDPNSIFRQVETQINVADVKTFIGLLIGGSVAMMFSALAIRAVGRTAGVVVQEVRNQFADGKIMKGTKKPDYAPVIDICTRASLRELATPALLAVLTPVIVGFGIGYLALGAFLAAIILTGQLMANYLSNAGGAWDNAKKYIEDGHMGGKGSEAHKAAVIGDTVGDPFKDTAGPALNPLIKVMNLVSLLILPAIIKMRNDDTRFVIAGVSLLVLIGAIVFSSRPQQGLGGKAPTKKAAAKKAPARKAPAKKAAAKKAPAKAAIATTARKRAAR